MKNDFQKTEAVFAKLDEVLSEAESAIEKKREQLKARQSGADQRISASLKENERLKNATAEISQKVEAVINHLDKVLNEDVSGYDNN